MLKVLNSLILSHSYETQRALESIMQNNIDGYILSFTSLPYDLIDDLDRDPDLIFIVKDSGDVFELMEDLSKRFARKTLVVLADVDEDTRRQYLRSGADEVMSLVELDSVVGRHLLEKLVTIKDLALAEARIEQSEERFRGIIEHSHDMILLLDEEGTIIYVSPAFVRQMGYETWEVLGQNFFALVRPEDQAGIKRSFQILLEMSQSMGISLEYYFEHKDGTWRSLETNATNLLSNETVQAIVFNSRDTTEQKIAEHELEKYRLHLEDLVVKRTEEVKAAHQMADMVVAASPDALIAIDNDGYVLFVSRHYKTMYPASVPYLKEGMHIMDVINAVTQELGMSEKDPIYAEMLAWWKEPKGYKEYKMHNGAWVRLQAKRMLGAGGIVISTTNISDYKRQQALLAAQSSELALALEKEREIVEQQKTFISTVSHEFRTPLTIIDGNAQIIQRRGNALGKDKLEMRAVTIRTAVERLVGLIDTILSAHVMDAGKMSFNPSLCNIASLLRETVSEIQDVSPNHKIKLEIDGVFESSMMDEKLMRQVMTNLISNAVKYSPRSPNVKIKLSKNENMVLLEVSDNGVGIPQAEIGKLFQKYFRASTSGGIPGSGLGLNLVRHFVEMHGGKVNVSSVVGQGTTFSVTLPSV